MARRRRYRRWWNDPAYGIVAIFSLAIICTWLIARHPSRKPAPWPKLTSEQARAFNARIPFADDHAHLASGYIFQGTPASREQAIQCLATAAVYEAGADERAQKAVIQVVLNRVRLPQFPKTICGVVYEGAALPTGCQFSFTCDGSQTRRPEYQGWITARAAAAHALNGQVFRPVGRATHYHADWMVPYWIGSLTKIAKIRGHIFYRPKRSDDPKMILPELPRGAPPPHLAP